MKYRCDKKEAEPSQHNLFSTEGGFEFENLPLFQEIFKRFPARTCEYSLANLFAWGPIYEYSWRFYRGRLLMYDAKNSIMLMPVGCAMTPDELFELSCEMQDMGLSPDICLVSKAYIDENPEIHKFYTVEEERAAAEYIYRTDDLIHLRGAKLHKKKNLVSQFHRHYPEHRVVEMDGAMRGQVMKFVQDQLAQREVSQSLEEELVAIKRAFDHWDELALHGLVVLVEDRIAAFSVFSRLNEDTFNVHFEKSDVAFKGAAQVINQETAKVLEDRCTFINREQDLGIPGLRKAKLSYEPADLFLPHILTLKSGQ